MHSAVAKGEIEMRVIFAGPTVHGADLRTDGAYELRPPAGQGDVHRAVEDGATVIGLIDGVYDAVPAVWHKEILYGLSQGVHMFGAASIGALRAAECAPFGMVGIGKIYEGYASGLLEEDADVAQSHAPADLGYLPLSVPLVNARATLAQCRHLALVTLEEEARLQRTAEETFFKNRTYRQLVRDAISDVERASTVLAHLRANAVNPKLQDALRLIDRVIGTPDRRFSPQFDWRFHATSFWETQFCGDVKSMPPVKPAGD
ncbi:MULTISPECIES: TfuA-like protein [Rhizobium]|uniref:TfuA-like protein n=1 Tax=Rhizobium rhododendri TaxID=2506430 RepID=A0ABY8IPL7_9HYPH|nr:MULTISPECIES: TfuA-like protein [Rhizobium]MBZ5761887.1 antibiotic resistance protein [Rhizobium sp. VS19-DR96]MBZ5767919.1 antibiotic resistance protein [Rhizobium sp. VS19-DR129.2]MBZ5775267.1 antibiotic resistance protein [Rhizobium sp. VS19-DRK62.2]MBZ5786766.1 antibiotic resistance protein [Rhizobium sp. VS19-DR121]MBZ5803922.1 antibiotic resistance protein [Rhizobium sp. VS19-DR181]